MIHSDNLTNLVKYDAPLSKVYHDESLVGDGTRSRPLRLSTSALDDALALTAAPTANTTASGLTITLTANENQGFGDAIRIASDGEAQLSDATDVATSYAIGLCTGAVTTGNTGTYLLQGIARNDSWNWTVGNPIYLSVTGTTTNTLTQTAPSATDEVVQILGIATHADRIYWNPSLTQVVNL